MLTKSEIKKFSSLLTKKYRQREKKFIVEGRKLVEEGLNSSLHCDVVIASKSFNIETAGILNVIQQKKIRIEIVNPSIFKKIGETKNPQGIAAVFQSPAIEKPNYDSDIIIALEDVSDPGNLGSIIRTADWFGINEIILSPDCVDPLNPKVVRATMGAIFRVKCFAVKDFNETISHLKKEGRLIVCADMFGENLYSYKKESKSIIIFGKESSGVSDATLKIADKRITIPGKGAAESLNVAAAAAIFLSELTK